MDESFEFCFQKIMKNSENVAREFFIFKLNLKYAACTMQHTRNSELNIQQKYSAFFQKVILIKYAKFVKICY